MSLFIYNKNNIEIGLTEVVFREINNDKYPEIYIEGKNEMVSIDLMLSLNKEDLDDFIMDEEVDVNEYLIGNELFLGINKKYDQLNISDIDIILTKIDKDYYNIRIEIPKDSIIIEDNITIEEKQTGIEEENEE